MWGQISGVAGQFKRTINAVASEIKDAVEEVRGADEEPAYQSARQLGQDVPKAVSARSSTRAARVSDTSSRLEAIKARLEAERAGSSASRQASGASLDSPQPFHQGHDQKHQLAQTAQVSALPLRSEPVSLPGRDPAAAPLWSRAAQAEPSLHASRSLQQEQSTALKSTRDGPFSTGQVPAHAGTSSTLQQSESKPPWIRSDAPSNRAPAQRTASGDNQNAGRTLHTSLSPAVARQGSPEMLRSQMQHLKAELVATAAAHEEEETRLAQSYEQRLQASEAKNAELAGQLSHAKDNVKASSDQHARIMELQVRLKEEQAEKDRLLDQIASAEPSSIPFASGTQQPKVDEDTFWASTTAADSAPPKKAEELSSDADAPGQAAALQQQIAQTKVEGDEQLKLERSAHAATKAALEGQLEQARRLEDQLHAAQAALQSEQSASHGLQSELSRAQDLRAEVQERLASRDAAEQQATKSASQDAQAELQGLMSQLSQAQAVQADLQKRLASRDSEQQHAAEAASQVAQAEVQGLQAEVGELRAAAASAEQQLQEEQQEHLQSLQALEDAQEGHSAAVSELEAEKMRHAQHQEALQKLQHIADQAAQTLAAEQASHAETQGRLSELQAALDEAQSASAGHKDLPAEVAAARDELDTERQAHAKTKQEAERCREQAAESGTGQAAAEDAVKALEASKDDQRLLAQLEQLRAELHQALEGAAQQGDQASRSQEELRESRHEKESLESLVAELNSKCAQLQEDLESARQQLHHAEQESKVLVAAQLLEHEAAWKSSLHDSQQKLQQARDEIADLEQQLQDLRLSSAPSPAVPDSNDHGMSTNPLYAEADSEAAGLKEKMSDMEQELERTKQQLQRLKQATVMRQEDEEDGLRWRVEAEVRLAVDRAQQASAQQEAQMNKDMADLRADLAHAREQLDGQGIDLGEWRAAVAAKDLEIQNLQAALGELAYKSETAERLRLDLRKQAAKLREAEERCNSIKQALDASEASQQALQQELQAASQQAEMQRGLERRLSDEAAMLRRALSQSMHQLKLANSDAGAMVDRRIVTKLLLTWMERGHNDQSVLNLMASMLGFTEDEKRRIGIAQGPGIIKTVAGAPIALIKGLATSGDGTPKGKDGLANQWVDFLIEQANAADAVQPQGPSRAPSLGQAVPL